jgi:hypothetical protein
MQVENASQPDPGKFRGGRNVPEKTALTPRMLVGVIKMLSLDQQVQVMVGNPEFGGNIIFLPSEDGGERETVILNCDENKNKALDFLYRHAEEQSKTVSQFFLYIHKPNRLQILNFVTRAFSMNGEYESILKDAWLSTEFPHQTRINELIGMFNQADRDKLMTGEEKAFLNGLPDEFTVYRGYSETLVKRKMTKRRGLSWSLKKEKAIWFAKRWSHPDSRLLEGRVRKSDVYMYSDERGESEIVVNPRRVRGIEITELQNNIEWLKENHSEVTEVLGL